MALGCLGPSATYLVSRVGRALEVVGCNLACGWTGCRYDIADWGVLLRCGGSIGAISTAPDLLSDRGLLA